MVYWNVMRVSVSLLLAAICLGSVAGSIFPDEDFGYRHYAKREISSYCLQCASTYSYVSCLRCWNTKYAVIPFHSKRSSDVVDTAGSDVMMRERRFTGCSCCFQSRFTNSYCCNVCNRAAKRMGKRSGDMEILAPEPEKRMNPDCFCCRVSPSSDCCDSCSKSYEYYKK